MFPNSTELQIYRKHPIVWYNNQMGIRYLCISCITYITSWYCIRSQWASPLILNVVFLTLTTIYTRTTCLTQSPSTDLQPAYRGSPCTYKVCLATIVYIQKYAWRRSFTYRSLLGDDRRTVTMPTNTFPHTRKIRHDWQLKTYHVHDQPIPRRKRDGMVPLALPPYFARLRGVGVKYLRIRRDILNARKVWENKFTAVGNLATVIPTITIGTFPLLVDFHRILLTHALGLSADQFCYARKSP